MTEDPVRPDVAKASDQASSAEESDQVRVADGPDQANADDRPAQAEAEASAAEASDLAAAESPDPLAAEAPDQVDDADEDNSRVRTHWRGGSRRQALYFIVLGMLLVGVVLLALDQWRKGLVVMGSSLLLAGVARAMLPTRLVGWLAVRNRSSDLVFCILFGAMLITTAMVARGTV